jgi:hypothetical protein
MAGTVDVISGTSGRPLVERVHRRYVTEVTEANELVGAFLNSDDVTLRFSPQSAITWDERESDASRTLRDTGGALPLVPTEPRP